MAQKPVNCPSCFEPTEGIQCLGCGAKRAGNLWWYEEGGKEAMTAKKKEAKRRSQEEYMFCLSCESYFLKDRLQKDVFGNKYCPLCEEDIKEEKPNGEEEE